MQPLGIGQQQHLNPLFDDEKMHRLAIVSDEEVENMSREDTIELYKKAKVVIISEHSRNERMATELEGAKGDHARALAAATQRQAAANITENQRNRQDFNLMERNTTICTVGRTLSLVVSVAMFILSMLLFFL